MRKHDKVWFVVSSCFCFFQFSRQKSENTRQYDKFYVSYIRVLFVVFSLFRIVVFSLFCIFASRLRMRRSITNMLGGVNDNNWIGACAGTSGTRKSENATMRKYEKAKIQTQERTTSIFTLPLSSFCIFASKLWRSENTKIQKSQTLSCFCIFALLNFEAKKRKYDMA